MDLNIGYFPNEQISKLWTIYYAQTFDLYGQMKIICIHFRIINFVFLKK